MISRHSSKLIDRKSLDGEVEMGQVEIINNKEVVVSAMVAVHLEGVEGANVEGLEIGVVETSRMVSNHREEGAEVEVTKHKETTIMMEGLVIGEEVIEGVEALVEARVEVAIGTTITEMS